MGDLVPLVGENRALVQAGLRTLQEEPRPGLYALLQAAGAGEELSGTDVAFKLCPRINAAGRMDSALRALELLLAEDEETAAARARQLCDDNALRQELERKIIDDITAKLAADPAPLRQRVLVVAGEDYHPGVIGIVASHLVERYGKPTVVLDMKADGTACGSARSIEGFDLYRAVAAMCSPALAVTPWLRVWAWPRQIFLFLPEPSTLMLKRNILVCRLCSCIWTASCPRRT